MSVLYEFNDPDAPISVVQYPFDPTTLGFPGLSADQEEPDWSK